MTDIVTHVWPDRPKPKSYFGLLQQFLGAVPHIKVMKRSACIEGARMALARVKTHWTEMDATAVATRVRTITGYQPSTILAKCCVVLV